jgi:hypothetical protein
MEQENVEYYFTETKFNFETGEGCSITSYFTSEKDAMKYMDFEYDKGCIEIMNMEHCTKNDLEGALYKYGYIITHGIISFIGTLEKGILYE